MGVPLPHEATWLTIGTELIGDLAVLLGAFLVWASIPTAAVLLVAMVTVHLRYGFSSVKLLGVSAFGAQFGPVGFELDLLYLAALLLLALRGSGKTFDRQSAANKTQAKREALTAATGDYPRHRALKGGRTRQAALSDATLGGSNLSLPLGGTHELGPWRCRIDTALDSPHDIVELEDASSVSA